MTAATTPQLGAIHAFLAERGYEVSEIGPSTLNIKEVHTGVSVHGVLEGKILFFSLTCTVVPDEAITPTLMGKMLAANNGIHTSHFQLYPAGDGKVAITLANFCKLQEELDADVEDEILSCVHFLLVDVITARQLLGSLES